MATTTATATVRPGVGGATCGHHTGRYTTPTVRDARPPHPPTALTARPGPALRRPGPSRPPCQPRPPIGRDPPSHPGRPVPVPDRGRPVHHRVDGPHHPLHPSLPGCPPHPEPPPPLRRRSGVQPPQTRPPPFLPGPAGREGEPRHKVGVRVRPPVLPTRRQLTAGLPCLRSGTSRPARPDRGEHINRRPSHRPGPRPPKAGPPVPAHSRPGAPPCPHPPPPPTRAATKTSPCSPSPPTTPPPTVTVTPPPSPPAPSPHPATPTCSPCTATN